MSSPLWQGSKRVAPTAAICLKIMPQHLFVPNATWPGAPTVDLPHLQTLWRTWSPVATRNTPNDWASPIERVYAQTLGYAPPDPDAPLPFAALANVGTVDDQPCAWVRPVNVVSGMNEVIAQALPPHSLTPLDADTLIGAIGPLCQEDGMTLQAISPDRWLFKGERLRGITAPSLARARSQHLAPFVPFVSSQVAMQLPGATENLRWLLRLQNEVQMLFYTHPLNDTRVARRLPVVSGIWVEGAGELPERQASTADAEWLSALTDAADQYNLWVDAWRAIDSHQLATLCTGGSADDQVTFGSGDRAVTWRRGAQSLGAKISRTRRQWGLQKIPTLPHSLLANT